MSDKEKLIVTERSVKGKQVKGLRREGQLPIVIYGQDRKPMALSTDAHDFALLYRRAGHNTVVTIEIKKADDTTEKKNALIHVVAKDPVKGLLLHADLIQINMKEKITTMVPLKFVGNPVAVADLSGTLITSIDEVEVECLPGDLPHEIEVNIDSLVDFTSEIHISDIIVPEGVVIKTEAEGAVAHVEAPRSDEEMEELEAGLGETTPPETEGETAEGEAAPEEEKAK